MPTTIERPATGTDRRRRGIGAAVGAIAAIAALVPLATALEDGGRVDLQFVNTTEHDVGARVTGPSGGVLPVVHVEAGSSRFVADLLHDGGDLEVTWTIEGRAVATTTVSEGDDATVPADIRP